ITEKARCSRPRRWASIFSAVPISRSSASMRTRDSPVASKAVSLWIEDVGEHQLLDLPCTDRAVGNEMRDRRQQDRSMLLRAVGPAVRAFHERRVKRDDIHERAQAE